VLDVRGHADRDSSAVAMVCTTFFEESAWDCQWQLPAFGHSNPRTVQEALVFSLRANGTLRA
jgi:hypothetical protein